MSILMDFLQHEAGERTEHIANWLEETFSKAKYCSLCTHIGKFTNPSLNVDAFVPEQPHQNNGYVYTANVFCDKDIKRSATFDPTAKRLHSLLTLPLEDGRTVLTHFLSNSSILARDFSDIPINYQELYESVLQLAERGQSKETDEYIRQVFFPIGNQKYHLLSVLPPSSLLMETSKRLNKMAEMKSELDADSQKHMRIHDLTKIVFGGGNPQNISRLGTAYGKKTYMLPALPPVLEKRDVIHPKKDFFSDTLQRWQFKDLFQSLHACYARTQKNQATRKNIMRAEEHIIDKAFLCAERLRTLPEGWTDGKNVSLSKAQKLWLDEKYAAQRNEETDWKQEIAAKFARWIFFSYRTILKDKAFSLGDSEYSSLRDKILQIL